MAQLEVSVNAIVIDEKNKTVTYEFCNSEANMDWIRAGRLLRVGKKKKVEQMDNNKTVKIIMEG